MIPFVLSTLLTCEEGSDLIKKLVKPSLNETDKVELTEVIQSSSEPGCDWDAND